MERSSATVRSEARNQGLTADVLFVGLTRPSMVFGVTYSAMLANVVLTMETFIVTHNLLWLLSFLPIHALLYLVCLVEPRFFELIHLWSRTRGISLVAGNLRFWQAGSYSPLPIDLPDSRGRRRVVADRVIV